MSQQYQTMDSTMRFMHGEFADMRKNLVAEIKAEIAKDTARPFMQPQNDMNMNLPGLLRIQGGNALIIALGAAMASFFTGLFSKLLGGLGGIFGAGGTALTLPAGIGQIIVGLGLKHFLLKTGAGADFATGIFLSGVIRIVSGFTTGLGFAQPTRSMGGNMMGIGTPDMSVGVSGWNERQQIFNMPGGIMW